jgi:hypothetical protein
MAGLQTLTRKGISDNSLRFSHGGFCTTRLSPAMTNNIGKAPEEWRNFSTTHPLPAFSLKPGDLKRLFQIINTKQFEFRDRIYPGLLQQSNETEADFAARQQRVYNAFVTSVSITGVSNEVVHGNNEAFFDTPSIPERIKTVFYSTITIPQTILARAPLCNLTVLLDFSQPPLFNFGQLPSLPTPNASNFAISADDESWFTSTNARLLQFFSERKTKNDWLHRGSVYDLMLMFPGIPIALWAIYHVGQWLDQIKPPLPSFLTTAIYVYVFVVTVALFRVFFSYTRWVFPKVELESDLKSSPLRHRGVWGAILMPLIVALLCDAIKLLF